MSGRDDGFLGRWSRRKLAAEHDADARKRAPPEELAEGVAEVDEPRADAPEPEADAELLASLPQIDEITAATDIKVFLQKGVPTALRNAALRRAWATDPVISNYEDPARDYFWDWNAPGGVPGGGGMMNGERVAKMVRDLVGEVDAPAEVENDEIPTSGREDAAGQTAIPDQASPARNGLETQDIAQLRVRTPVPKQPPADVPTAPRRRHGGAMPD